MTKEEKAVHILDMFTKTWCIADNSEDEPEFNCSRCEFSINGGICSVKVFKQDKLPAYENFGSMIR